jgi:hypothetical protein
LDDSSQIDDALPLHEWQKKILDDRERLIAEGYAKFREWEESKKRISKQVLRKAPTSAATS